MNKKITREVSCLHALTTTFLSFSQVFDPEYPSKIHDLTSLPAVGIYRNGEHFLPYPNDDIDIDEDALRKWMMAEDTLLVEGAIEEVNARMLAHLYETDDDIVVLFYEPGDRDIDEILQGVSPHFDVISIYLKFAYYLRSCHHRCRPPSLQPDPGEDRRGGDRDQVRHLRAALPRVHPERDPHPLQGRHPQRHRGAQVGEDRVQQHEDTYGE